MTEATEPAKAKPAGPESVLVCANCGRKNKIRPSATGAPHCGNCGKPLPWLVNADDATFDIEANAAPAVVVDLWAPWCGPCRMVSPELEALARSHAGQVKLVKVNVDASPQIARRYAVQGIPTLLVLDRGEVIARQTGAAPEHVLRPWLDEALAKAASSKSSTAG